MSIDLGDFKHRLSDATLSIEVKRGHVEFTISDPDVVFRMQGEDHRHYVCRLRDEDLPGFIGALLIADKHLP